MDQECNNHQFDDELSPVRHFALIEIQTVFYTKTCAMCIHLMFDGTAIDLFTLTLSCHTFCSDFSNWSICSLRFCNCLSNSISFFSFSSSSFRFDSMAFLQLLQCFFSGFSSHYFSSNFIFHSGKVDYFRYEMKIAMEFHFLFAFLFSSIEFGSLIALNENTFALRIVCVRFR